MVSVGNNKQASTELNFLLYEIDLCLTLILSCNLKHIPSNTAEKHDVWGTISSAWNHRRVMVKHCGQLNLTVSDDSACDQAILRLVRSCWVNLSLFEELRSRSYQSILFF